MFGECHMHIFMNGVNYREAVQLHKNGVQEADIRKKLEQYKARRAWRVGARGEDRSGVRDRIPDTDFCDPQKRALWRDCRIWL